MARFTTLAAAGILSVATATSAFSHSTFEPQQVEAGKTHRHVLRVPHGCEGQATHTLRVTIPEGMYSVQPMPKAGWNLATTSGRYAKPILRGEKEITEGVREIVWSGGNLADAHYDEFIFRAVISPEAASGGTVFVPAVQECATAKATWTEVPAAGQDPHSIKMPAPGIRVILAQHSHGQPAPAATTPVAIRAGDIVVTGPWTRATPGGAKVAGGYMRLTNTGKESDRLVGGSLPQAGRFEVHEMATVNNVMTMRQLDKGLEIRPGETVELKPGGFHVMFMDLKEGVRQGQPIKGTLIFEKGGKVEIEYSVAPIGATSPGGGHSHH